MMKERRGRAVAFDRARERIHKFLGFTAQDAQKRLASPVDAWTLSLCWEGKEASGVEPVRWYASRASALSEMVRTADLYRLYPDAVTVVEEGVALRKEGKVILRAEPLRWHQVNAEVAEEVREWLRAGDDCRVELLRRIASLPNLARMKGPVVEVPRGWGRDRGDEPEWRLGDGSWVQSAGRLVWDVDRLDAQLHALFETQRIKMTREEARVEMARLLGFGEWDAALLAYKKRTVIDPYLVQDDAKGKHLLCRDLAEAIVAFEGLCAKRTQGLSWRYQEREGDVKMALVQAGGVQREAKELVRLESMDESRAWRSRIDETVWCDGAEECAAQVALMLGVNASPAERISASDNRLEASGMKVGKAYVSVRKDWLRPGDEARRSDRVAVEYLRDDDGWRDVQAEDRAGLLFYLDSYPDITGGADVCSRHGLELGHIVLERNRRKTDGDFMSMARIVGATAAEVKKLVEHLGLAPFEGKPGLFTDATRREQEERRWMRPSGDELTASMRAMWAREAEYEPPWEILARDLKEGPPVSREASSG